MITHNTVFKILMAGVVGVCVTSAYVTAEVEKQQQSPLGEQSQLQQRTPQQQQAQQAQKEQIELQGKIASIDQQRNTLTLEEAKTIEQGEEKREARSVQVSVDENTRIMDGARQIPLSELQRGKLVKVMCTENFLGKRVAQSISVQQR